MNLVASRATAGWMMDDELAWLASQARSCQIIIEVGCWLGRSTLALADNTTGTVYAVDHWRGTPGDVGQAKLLARLGIDGLYQRFLSQMNGRIEAGRVSPLRMNAAAAAGMFAPGSVDLVFLDATHLKPDVLRDIDMFLPLVKPGGILCGHDYACPSHPGVKQAVDERFPTVNRAGLSIWWVRV